MAARVLLRPLPGYGAVGQNAQIMVGVGYGRNADLGFPAVPFVVIAGTNQDSDPIVVAGFDAFMAIVSITNAGGSTTLSYFHDDPGTQATIVNRGIATGLLAGSSIATFGAYSTAAPLAGRSDTFHTITLRITAVTNDQTINDFRLWASAR